MRHSKQELGFHEKKKRPQEKKMLKNRKGRIRVAGSILKSEQEMLAETFAALKFVPIRIVPCPSRDAYDYVGFSERFEEIKEGGIIPCYDAIVREHEGKVSRVEAILLPDGFDSELSERYGVAR